MAEMAADSTFSKWVYSYYFKFIKEKDNNILVRNSTSNLKKHLEMVHANIKLTERDNVASKQKRKAEGESASKLKQQNLDFSGSVVLEP